MRLSISKIRLFKSCRRAYELRYIEGLEPVTKSDALVTGSNYHALLEELNNTGSIGINSDIEYTKELAMAKAYEKYIYPKFHVTGVERWLEYDLGEGDMMVGIVDAIADDGHIVEHKSYGSDITEEYEYNLLWDEQILAYMLMTGMRKVWYTVCRKPTIRQGKNESAEEFFDRMIAWYDEDTDSKIRLLEIERTDEEIEQFRQELFAMRDVMKQAEDKKSFYKNTCHCYSWGRRCEYSTVCLHYDPNQEYIEFIKEGQ